MKKHEIAVRPEYYELIKNGVKIYEGRLNDEKRQLIEVGDIIEIKKEPERKEGFNVKVLDKLFFSTFIEMARSLPSKDLGFESDSPTEIANVYRKFYDEEKENRYGVVAIKLQKIN